MIAMMALTVARPALAQDASPDAPTVDVAVTGGDVPVPILAFPNASDYLEVPTATYDLEVRAAGTTEVTLPCRAWPWRRA